MIREILDVRANDDFTLECEMDNGEVYLYDMSFVNKLDGLLLTPLRDIEFFQKVWLDDGALEWPTRFSIHGNTVVRDGELIKKSA